MAKYILDLSAEQAKTVAQACEFFARIKMGQFNEIPFLLLANDLPGNDYCTGEMLQTNIFWMPGKQFTPNFMALDTPTA